MAKLFLTGATGYVGSAVAQIFKNNGYEIVTLVRSKEAAEKAEKHGYQPLQGDLKNPESFKQAIAQADVVIHTAANDAEIPKAVEAILSQLKGTSRSFIYTSGVFVYGNTGNNTANEETATNPTQFASWRPQLEKQLQEAAEQGIKTVIIRPGIVYGNGGGIVGTYAEQAKKNGEVHCVGDGQNQWTTVHVNDLAKLYLLAVEKAKPGSLYNATHGPSVKQRQVVEAIFKAAGIPQKVKPLSIEEALKAIGGFAAGLALDQQVDSSKAKRELGWAPDGTPIVEDILASQKVLTERP
jgi:nucleoside-diphosphate-sugar epimerase